jgi:DUF1680 family protein
MHKILTGLIDVYNYEGNTKALSIAKKLGDWVYNRASKWDAATRSRVLGVEYGGMNDCLYELYKLTNNNNHLTAAHLFDETNLFNTIAAGTNNLPADMPILQSEVYRSFKPLSYTGKFRKLLFDCRAAILYNCFERPHLCNRWKQRK